MTCPFNSYPSYVLLGRYTADFMKKVPSVYTHLMETIYLSMSTQVAEGTAFRKLPVVNFKNISHKFCTLLLSTADYVRINKNERLVDPPPTLFYGPCP